jgi:DNA polymerase (family 10)
MQNKEIAQIFEEMADMLEILGEDIYKIRAYRRAALNIRDQSQSLKKLYSGDIANLKEIPAVGDQIAKKIAELLDTGKLKKHDELLKKVTPDILEMLKLPQVGPKHIKVIRDKLNIKNIDELKEACVNDKVSQLEGFGKKSQDNILSAIAEYRQLDKRTTLNEADILAAELLSFIKKAKIKIDYLEIAGSLRRGRETLGDIDILAALKEAKSLREHFIKYPELKTIIANGPSKVSIITNSDIQVDLRLVETDCFGSAWVHFTGSQAHNIHLRKIAKFKKLKLNEYGVFKDKKLLASKKEKDIYECLDLSYIPPELREDSGEIEAAEADSLPRLVKLKDIRGDLHMHTVASDGKNSIAEMADAAKNMGLEYIAITEHSKAVKVANGLSEKELSKHIKKIDRLNKKIKGIEILKGVEVDIEKDGKLNLDDSILKNLDIVIAAIHFRYDLNKRQMTDRILRAMDNKYVNIVAHPTGRLIGQRAAYNLELEMIFTQAHKHNIALELNSSPDKLDLNDINCRMAKEFNVKVIINSDSHSRDSLSNLKYGIMTARRGWLEKKDIVNTRKLKEFLKAIKRK